MELMRDRLLARWNRHFVGRAAELALLESLLRSGEDGAVVFVHGPGGVGKTTLLRRLGGLADEAGRRVVRVDGHDVPPLPAAFVAALAGAAGVRGATGLAEGEPGGITTSSPSGMTSISRRVNAIRAAGHAIRATGLGSMSSP